MLPIFVRSMGCDSFMYDNRNISPLIPIQEKRVFLDIFKMIFGSLLEKSFDFKIKTLSIRFLVIFWPVV